MRYQAYFRDVSGESMCLWSHWTYIESSYSLRDFLRSFTRLLNTYIVIIHITYLFTLADSDFVSESSHRIKVNAY